MQACSKKHISWSVWLGCPPAGGRGSHFVEGFQPCNSATCSMWLQTQWCGKELFIICWTQTGISFFLLHGAHCKHMSIWHFFPGEFSGREHERLHLAAMESHTRSTANYAQTAPWNSSWGWGPRSEETRKILPLALKDTSPAHRHGDSGTREGPRRHWLGPWLAGREPRIGTGRNDHKGAWGRSGGGFRGASPKNTSLSRRQDPGVHLPRTMPPSAALCHPAADGAPPASPPHLCHAHPARRLKTARMWLPAAPHATGPSRCGGGRAPLVPLIGRDLRSPCIFPNRKPGRRAGQRWHSWGVGACRGGTPNRPGRARRRLVTGGSPAAVLTAREVGVRSGVRGKEQSGKAG